MNQTKISRRNLFLASFGATLLAGCAGLAAAPPKAGGKAYKMTGNEPKTTLTAPEGREIATIAGGCFWCVEAIFVGLRGVDKVVSGYSGGMVPNPSYEAVCGGDTGHAEAINVIFDPKVIGYGDILRVFFTTHDPTTLNRQGADSGTQYRSAIFTHSPEQKATAEKVVKEITAEKLYKDPIVTEVTPFTNFYAAEDYHQNYYARNSRAGYCSVVIEPKVRKFREKYANLLKK